MNVITQQLQNFDSLSKGYEIMSSIQTIELFDLFEPRGQQTGSFHEITEATIGQLRLGVYNKYGAKRYPKLEDQDAIENLFEVIVREPYYDYLDLSWLHKMDIRIKPKEGINHICKHAKVLDKDVIIIQCIEHDFQFSKIISSDIELMLLIDEIKERKPHMIVPKNEIFEMNELEIHGVKFNSTPEQLDDQGNVITNLDHYDNYCYLIYDSLRNTFKHYHREDINRYAEEFGIWMEEWIDNHHLTNDIDIILEYWDDVAKVIDNYVFKYEHNVHRYFDRNTFGTELYEYRMKRISNLYDVPITVCWDIWKIKTIRTFKRILKELDNLKI